MLRSGFLYCFGVCSSGSLLCFALCIASTRRVTQAVRALPGSAAAPKAAWAFVGLLETVAKVGMLLCVSSV